MLDERQWYRHAQDAGFVFLELPALRKGTPRGGKNDPPKWTKRGVKRPGKFASAEAALTWRGDGPDRRNLAVGTEDGGRGIILDADDDEAVANIARKLADEGVTTLSMSTPRGVAWLFTLPAGVELAKLNESMVSGLGLLGTRPAGHYQVGPGSRVDAGAYGPNKTPPDESGGPWRYRVRDVAPVATMPDRLIEALREARARSRGEAGSGARQGAGERAGVDAAGSAGRRRTGGQALGCRTVERGIEVLRDLVQGQGAGRNDSVYRVACSLIWHGALTDETRGDVEAKLIDVQRELRAGESRDVTREVPEQVRHAFAFIASQGGPGRGSDTGEFGEEPVPPHSDDLAGDFKLWRDDRQAFREAQSERKPRTLRALREAASDRLASIIRRVPGADVSVVGDLDVLDALDALAVAFGEGGDEGERAIKAMLAEWERRGIVAEPVEWEAKPEPRQWLVPNWLPCGRIGMVTGKGESGKSRLTLQLAAVLASGGAVWLPAMSGAVGAVPIIKDRESGEAWGKLPVVVATWEDEADELRRRLHDMNGVGVKPADVGANLHHVDLSGAGPLWAPAKAGSGHVSTLGALTGAGRWLRKHCEAKGARLLVVDPLAAAFACSENDRGLVRHFMSDWDNWARDMNEGQGCAVLVVSHPSKDSTGNADYSQSGSTDWHAASRFCWLMEATDFGPEPEQGKQRNKAMKLSVTKSNYGIGAKPETWLNPCGAGWQATDEAGLLSGTGGEFGGGR